MFSRFTSLVVRAAVVASSHNKAATPIISVTLPSLRSFATNSTDVFNVHHDTPENNKDTKFDFTEANYKLVNKIMSNYPSNYKASAMIPLLDLAQQQNGGVVSLAVMNRVAQILEVPPIKVYEVATFFTMFNRSKMGKYHVCICGTTPCRLQGAQKIEEAITKHLGVGIGQTTADGTFTLGEMECMGACVNAPMIAVADYRNGVEGFSYNYYEDLTPQDAVNILEKLKKGEKPKLGSQHRQTAEPAGAVVGDKWIPSSGEQTLMGELPGPYCRDLSK
uniref:24 kDa n=1 Tax=Polytomella sp. Pringsheim 198.80 TaxID=37502 RepID=UPI0016DAA387|nr:Chain E, kDa [Polytomella sp. Pringsheim 198.80]7ARD_E Chain E, kDa [Polytomella sp. Pringsheim 198.80]|mmetsp:Transcript_5765/g.11026  ORF Transcript_5765/g.11026 Transcript_5765/m.11026 type:complete len:277 (-) Transcript_5765:532-1362(-)